MRRRPVEQFRGGHSVRLLRDGHEAYPAMLHAIDGAQRFVLLEMYWFAADRVGSRFVAALERAARRGVQVLMLYDAVGSFGLSPSDFGLLRQLAAIVEHNPISPLHNRFHLGRATRRDHRKLLVVDGRAAFVGGINLAEAWLAPELGGEGWRDDALEVMGPVVAELTELFMATWRRNHSAPVGAFAFEAFSGPEGGRVRAAVLGQGGVLRRRQAIRAYLHWLRRARQRIWIANAYFVPTLRLVGALRGALKRGVEVRLLLPARSDVPLVRHASRALWGPLLRAGAEIYEWMPSMLHSKTALVDRRWVTVGSFNLDSLSIRRNLELNVSVLDSHFARRIEASFERDFAQSRRVDSSEFARRSAGQRLLEVLAYGLRHWL